MLRRHRITNFGLAVPYTDAVTERTIATYRDAGFTTVAHANLGIAVGKEMANVPLTTIRDLLRRADSPEAECLIVICTGLPAALVVEEMEQELGKPIFDSVAVTFDKALRLVGRQQPLADWGALLRGDTAVAELLPR